ncbi:hypothetical protein [Prosthecobacter vanneervenii]|uniref:Uncharacterized protein n=1 Tax=Prosthecobacter vanneervenii TaxID=48466 RepID=A0A7W7YAL3_9BACT|nr:hypothetical protein [Prosthecobacter vanneervenii]MBB5032669.1 hypothetical protein [Prosthecobacter vanneervenii]
MPENEGKLSTSGEKQRVDGQMEKADLHNIIQQLEEQIRPRLSQHDELRLEAESSYSESVLIGSREAYLHAALMFLQIACSGSVPEAFDTKTIFNEESAVWPVAGYVTETDDEAQTLASSFR